MKYQMTNLEKFIKNLFTNNNIFVPSDISMEKFADSFDIWIHYREQGSEMHCINGLYSIILDSRLTRQEQFQDFAHEFGHVIKHEGNQHLLAKEFIDLQEFQANNFMYHFCVPTFMLLNCALTNYLSIYDGIQFISKTFNVTENFAQKRVIHFQNQCIQAKSDDEHRTFMKSLYPKAPPYSAATNALLNKLYAQLEKKGLVQ